MITACGNTYKNHKIYDKEASQLKSFVEREYLFYQSFLLKVKLYKNKYYSQYDKELNKEFFITLFNESLSTIKDYKSYFSFRIDGVSKIIDLLAEKCAIYGLEEYIKYHKSKARSNRKHIELPYIEFFFNDNKKTISYFTNKKLYNIWISGYKSYDVVASFYYYGFENYFEVYHLRKTGKTTIIENNINHFFNFDIKKLKPQI